MKTVSSLLLFPILLVVGFSPAQVKEPVVYGSMMSDQIRILRLAPDGSFFLLMDGVDEQGRYALDGRTSVVLTSERGLTIEGVLANDTLTLPRGRLIRTSGNQTMAAFLEARQNARVLEAKSRASIVANFYALAYLAKAHRSQDGSYSGFVLPAELSWNEHATFLATATSERITFVGTAKKTQGSVQVTLLPDGTLSGWTYFGSLQ